MASVKSASASGTRCSVSRSARQSPRGAVQAYLGGRAEQPRLLKRDQAKRGQFQTVPAELVAGRQRATFDLPPQHAVVERGEQVLQLVRLGLGLEPGAQIVGVEV